MPVRLMSAAACALVAVGLAALLWRDRAAAAHFVREDGPVEWMQAALLAAAMVAAMVCWLALARVRRPVAIDVMMAAMMGGLLIGELDLDKRVFGVKVVSTKFFVSPAYPLAYRVLGFLLVVGPPVALAIYAWRRRAELWSAARRVPREPWGQVFLAGGVVFGVTAIFERQLGYVPGYPRNFLEEGLEMSAAICFFLAVVARRHAIMRSLKPLIIAVVALASVVLAGCRGEGPASASQDKGKPPAAAPRPVRVAPAAEEMVRRSAVLDEARLTRDRSVKLLEQDLIARAQVDTATANLQVAEGRYQDTSERAEPTRTPVRRRRAALRVRGPVSLSTGTARGVEMKPSYARSESATPTWSPHPEGDPAPPNGVTRTASSS